MSVVGCDERKCVATLAVCEFVSVCLRFNLSRAAILSKQAKQVSSARDRADAIPSKYCDSILYLLLFL